MRYVESFAVVNSLDTLGASSCATTEAADETPAFVNPTFPAKATNLRMENINGKGTTLKNLNVAD